jgi:hypothetical protein
MRKSEDIVRRWLEGETTTTGLLVDLLAQTDKRVVLGVLAKFPPEVLPELREFVGYYTPATKLFRCDRRPSMDTIKFVKNWFAERKRSPSVAAHRKVRKTG